MINKIGALFGAMLVALGLGLAIASPAQAVIGPCPSNWICFYNTGTSSSFLEGRDASDAGLNTCYNMPSGANDATSYIINRSGKQFKTYSGSGCAGIVGTIYASSSGGMSADYNNNISAYKRVS